MGRGHHHRGDCGCLNCASRFADELDRIEHELGDEEGEVVDAGGSEPLAGGVDLHDYEKGYRAACAARRRHEAQEMYR